MSATAELAADVERLGIGGNNPPEPTPYDAIKAHIDDLYEEAKPWLTGSEVTTEDQAETIKRLKDDFAKAHKAADAARVEENKPFDDGKAAVQAKYNILIGDTKAVRGKTVLAIATLNEALTPYLRRKEAEQAAEAKRLREEAEKKLEEAAQASREASGDLEAKEAAEELITAATLAANDAKRAETAKVHVRGDGRAQGLKSFWSAKIVDRKAALLHYIQDWPPEIIAAIQTLADQDVRAGKRQVPGIEAVEDRRVA